MNRLVGLLESTLKVSGVLAVFGYMSLRAHLNYLGFSSASPLTSERYLMEAYQWLVLTLEPVVSITMALGGLLGGAWLVASAAGRHHARPHSPSKGNAFGYALCHERTAWLVVFGLIIVLFTWQDRFSSGRVVADLIIGRLNANQIPDGAQLSKKYIEYIALCLICGWGMLYAIFGWAPSKEPLGRERLLRSLQILALLLLTFHIPISFAQSVHAVDYPTAEVRCLDGSRIKGILILETATDVQLWQADLGVGRTIAVPRTQIGSITFGPLQDVMEEARKAARPVVDSKP